MGPESSLDGAVVNDEVSHRVLSFAAPVLDGATRVEGRVSVKLADAYLPVLSIPEGIVFILGTQKLDLSGIPPEVKANADAEGHKIIVAGLAPEAVARIVAMSGLPADVSAELIYAKSQGHPLSVRYLIESVRGIASPQERAAMA